MKKPRHLKVSHDAMERWRDANPYCEPYETWDDAKEWASKIRTVHRDKFSVIPVPGGYGVEQDAAEVIH